MAGRRGPHRSRRDERILIVDDKIEIITLLTDLLEPLGYHLSVAMDGREGLARALQEVPDLILLDVNMPLMSGLEVMEALHREDFPSPVILMTLYGSESVVVQAMRLGARDYVSKPFDINELLVSIDWALEEGRLRRERERLVAKLSDANRLLTQRMRELVTLQAVGRSVASLMPRAQVLRRILEAALYLTGTDASAVFLFNPEDEKLHLVAVHDGQTYGADLTIDAQDSHAEDVLRSGRPTWISAPRRATGVTTYLGKRAHALLYVPISLGEAIIGVLGVVCTSPDRPLSSEIEGRLMALSDYAAIALSNARLYESSQQQAYLLATVNRMAQTVVSTLDLHEIILAVVREVRTSVRAETASLILCSEDGKELVFDLILGDHEAPPAPMRLKAGQGLAGWTIDNRQTVRVDDVSLDPRFYHGVDDTTGFQTRSVLCVPLVISDRAVGAIEAINKLDDQAPGGYGHFCLQDEELLQGAAAFVAMAVENARLHAATRETVAAETLQETVTTICHHVNNPLQALLGATDLLRHELDGIGQLGVSARSTIRLMDLKIAEIAAVLSILRDITVRESVVYLGSLQMLDIEEELRRRLGQANH